jgi:hypothetical protein
MAKPRPSMTWRIGTSMWPTWEATQTPISVGTPIDRQAVDHSLTGSRTTTGISRSARP